jgi:hypothetical protein
MSEFYRFPAMAGLKEYSTMQQANHIASEAREVIEAALKMRMSYAHANDTLVREDFDEADNDRCEYGKELMDIIHSAETALRMGFSDEQVDRLRELVIEKNATRGYYDAEYQWKDSEMTIGDSIEGKAQ